MVLDMEPQTGSEIQKQANGRILRRAYAVRPNLEALPSNLVDTLYHVVRPGASHMEQ